MLAKKKEENRFTKEVSQIRSQKAPQSQQIKQPSTQTSFHQDYSLGSDKSTNNGSQTEAPSITQMDEPRALKLLLQGSEVLINKQVVKLKTQIVPTSNGERAINLSWLHSVKQLQPGKILLLYYDLRGLGEGKVKMQSLIFETGRRQGSTLYSALSVIHEKYHDEEVQKVYHFLC